MQRLDYCGWVSLGLYSKEYGSQDQTRLSNLYASLGMFAIAPEKMWKKITIRGIEQTTGKYVYIKGEYARI